MLFFFIFFFVANVVRGHLFNNLSHFTGLMYLLASLFFFLVVVVVVVVVVVGFAAFRPFLTSLQKKTTTSTKLDQICLTSFLATDESDSELRRRVSYFSFFFMDVVGRGP